MAYTTDERETEHAPELDATEARQGRWGRHVLWVLLAGLILVAIALFGTWALRAPGLQELDDRSRAVVLEEGPSRSTELAPVKNKAEVPPSEQNPVAPVQ